MKLQQLITRKIFVVSISLAVLGSAAVVIWSPPDPVTLSAQSTFIEQPVLTVTATQPRVEQLAQRVIGHGNIMPWQEAIIGTEADGLRLTEVKVNVGDKVVQGQLLATFAADTLQAELALSRAERAEAIALYAEARADLKRVTELQLTGALSSQQIQRYITAAQSAQARLDAARANEQRHTLRLAQSKVLAPDHGVISARTATVGAVLPAGQELFRLIRRSQLEWRAEVSADDLARLKPGQSAQISLADGSQLQGTLRMVSPVVDTQSRNALVYVDLTPSDALPLRAGMFARGEFAIGESRLLTLPQSAVQLRDGVSYVLRLSASTPAQHTQSRIPHATLQQLKIITGRRLADRIEIISGLQLSDRVVSTGGAFLGDGDLVRVVPKNSIAGLLEADAKALSVTEAP